MAKLIMMIYAITATQVEGAFAACGVQAQNTNISVRETWVRIFALW
jgi:hypothetical protein